MKKINIIPKLKNKKLNTIFHKKSFWALSALLVLTGVFIAIPSSTPSPHSVGIKSDEIASMGQNGAPSSISLGPDELNTVYTSPEYKTDYEFNAVAPHWKETNTADDSRSVEIRTSPNGRDWSGWLEVEASGPLRDNDPHPDRTFTENPLFIEGEHVQYRLTLSRSNLTSPSPEISDLKVTYLDSRSSKSQQFVEQLSQIKSKVVPEALAADQGPNVVSRAGWGSPDPYGTLYDNTGSELEWPPAGAPVSQVFIHHTVNANYQSDPAAVVRGIWEFHTKTRGWGDIGYNYLVDHNGTVYEGRTGGDNIVGAHVLGYNSGSLGVALIGCYDKNNSTCNYINGGSTNGPSNAVLHGLTDLLAWKTTNFEINPHATHNFCSSGGCLNLSTIAGHRDANQTGCPGDLLYDSLPMIRDEIARKKATYTWHYSAKQLSYNTADLVSSPSNNITLSFKNTGLATWSNTTNRILLKTANPNERTSIYQGANWLNSSTPAVLNEANVAPGGIGTFTFNMKQANNTYGNTYEGFRLVADGIGIIWGYYTMPIAGPVFSSTFAVQDPYPAILKGSQKQASISYKNTGNQPWYDDTSLSSAPTGARPVHLSTSRDFNRSSVFGSSWGASQNRPAINFAGVYRTDGSQYGTNPHIVQPGESVRFEFNMSVPSNLSAGSYREYFQPIVEGGSPMNDAWTFLDVTVEDVRNSSAFKAVSTYPALLPGSDNQPQWLEFKNTGNQTWYDDTSLISAPAGTKPIHLATSREINRSSVFGSSWGGSQNRPAVNFAGVYNTSGVQYSSNPHTVQPGESVRFEYNISIPYNLPPGKYREFFQPIIEGGDTMNDAWTFTDVTVGESIYTSAYAAQCAYPKLTRGATAKTCSISYKNTGNQPWYDDTSVGSSLPGTKPVHLATSRGINRSSAFGSSWGGSQNRPAVNFAAVYNQDGVTLAANQHVVQHGQIAKFEFTLSASTSQPTGTYREYFQPIVEGGSIMNDAWTFLDVTAE